MRERDSLRWVMDEFISLFGEAKIPKCPHCGGMMKPPRDSFEAAHWDEWRCSDCGQYGSYKGDDR